jgi:hypothetical protein
MIENQSLEIPKLQFDEDGGVRQCLMIKEKLGNGIGTCICLNQADHC